MQVVSFITNCLKNLVEADLCFLEDALDTFFPNPPANEV